MKYLRSFGQFWYDFIVGDDWTLAAGAVLAMAATFVLTHRDVNAWWLLPLAVFVMLGTSVRQVARARSRPA